MKAGLSVLVLCLLSSSCKVYKPSGITLGTDAQAPDESTADAGIARGAGGAGKSGASGDGGNPITTPPPAAGTPGTAGAAGDTDVAGAGGAAGTAGSGSTNQPTDVACRGGQCWWSKDAAAPACSTVGAPTSDDRPKDGPDSAEPLADIYVGWDRVWIGETDLAGTASDTAWQTFGLDLDSRCTNSSTCPAMQVAQGPQGTQACIASEQLPFDGESCRDNTFASLQPVAAAVPEIGQRFGISEATFNCNLWRGTYTVALRVSGYNGETDDSDVRVDVYTATGTVRRASWQCPAEDPRSYPLWLTSWPWTVDSASLSEPVQESGAWPDSKLSDAHAYVRGGYLVAHMPDDSLIRLATDGTQFRGWAMKVQGSVWTGQLVRGQDQRWHIQDGLVAGRLRSDDLVQSFRQLGLCEGVGLDGFYEAVQEYARNGADLLADGSIDDKRNCDAMSFGIAFEAAQLTPGPVADAIPLVECCEPGVAIEDCNPKCGDGRLNGKEHCDTAIADGQPGACPKTCTPMDACTPRGLQGTGCDTECAPMPITLVGAKDGCCPMGADATADSDCAKSCGNGVVEPGETCDPSETCPVCKSDDVCLATTAAGAADSCTLSCSVALLERCLPGDGCCPKGCSAYTDSDCSTTCRDGRIDAKETCEPGSNTPCPASCDDKEPCTQDFQTGSADNCNVRCTHLPITQAIAGDQCCPKGASANTDSDCAATCGNRKVEGTEQCDDGNLVSGDGCSADCKKESTVDQCLSKLDGRRPECAQCNCQKCQKEVLQCYAASSATETKQCVDVARCGLENGCSSTNCYCGSSDLASCLLGTGNGKCMSVIEAAAGSILPATIVVRSSDANYPLGRANLLATCAKNNCEAECALLE